MSGRATGPEHGTYLGDGVYLWDDGFQLWLAVGNHHNTVVALEPGVFARLKETGDHRLQQMYPPREAEKS